jgi:phage repressor protein C with HTH and peptisase S24 domain
MRWRRVSVRGPSMSPTLGDGDVVLVRFGAPVRVDDVVLVTWPTRPGQLSVKRAVRREGGRWWVLGDNPRGSTDSRTLGPADVPAVVRWRLWPRPGPLRPPPSRTTFRDQQGPC